MCAVPSVGCFSEPRGNLHIPHPVRTFGTFNLIGNKFDRENEKNVAMNFDRFPSPSFPLNELERVDAEFAFQRGSPREKWP